MSTIRGHININPDLTQVVGDKNYELSNLPTTFGIGNVLQVVTDRKLAQDNGVYDPETGTYYTMILGGDGEVDYYVSDVVSQSDYYPFGMMLPGRNSSGDYRYGFQNQETDDEIKGEGNSVNYKYRMHDPRIGRFFAVDPLADQYPYYSPFAFSGNRLIDAVEIEGLEPGVLFSSTEAAANNYADIYGAFSITENREYSATIYSTTDAEGKISYFYNNPKVGGEKGSPTNKPELNNATPVPGIHTHGAYSGRQGDNKSSSADKSLVGYGGLPEYIATPSGVLLVTELTEGADPGSVDSYTDSPVNRDAPNDGADPENVDPENTKGNQVLQNRPFRNDTEKAMKKMYKEFQKENKTQIKKYKKEFKQKLKTIEG